MTVSVFAKSQQRAKYEEIAQKIVSAKAFIDENPTSTIAANKALNELLPLEDEITPSKNKSQKNETIVNSYLSLLTHCYAILGDWSNVRYYAAQLNGIDENAIYFEALSFIEYEQYGEAEQLLGNYYYKGGKSFESKELNILYAQILAKQKKYTAALDIYEKIGVNQLDSVQKMNLGKVYYNLQKYDSAINVIKLSKETYQDYMLGICYLNLKDWKAASNSFNVYVSKNGKKALYSEVSEFYKAYATYKMGNYKEAYIQFSDFADNTSEIALARQSYELGAKSAVLISDYTKAAELAEKLIKISFKEEEIHNAVLFCAEIYTECQNYSMAEVTLNPYINEKSDFGLTCLFTLAQIFEKAGKYSKADDLYLQIQEKFSTEDLAEDAAYKDGELFYAQNDYSTAANRFSSYIKSYPRGKYIEAAYYFCGECYLRCKEYDLSIINSKNIVTKYPASVYMYGANKNLFQAYYESEDYNNALKIAKTLVNNYNSQAVQDGIPYQIKILNSIVAGNKKVIAEKQAEVEKLGGIETKNGRLAAYELFNLYIEESEDDFALALAKNLQKRANEKDVDEAFGLGQVTEYIADWDKEENKPALYIKAAEYYRLSGKDKGNAPAVLYKAVSSFLELRQTGDARETANALKKLYPESRQSRNVDALF